ncbi:aluminum activated malate transporter-domain-containing protein [Mucor mucedo]|uniref:aluminum activated malate transporter-domain-containing protein n=1 Tax=Mucor mucedo TaxID=29922 RepID=UPI0022202C8F|nr:aluminum activated malate transporter-domain-containing protein [Mucor mucedo]KAI7890866.1 aluminum activated malate transporter-domain-containing protein [Mucor mucedo]
MIYYDESHRPSNAESQSSTVREFPKDEDTIMNLKDILIIKEEEDNLSFKSLVQKIPGQERITIVEDVPFPRSEYGPPSPVSITKKTHPWVENLRQSTFYTWIHKQAISPDNRYAFQMATAFTIAALLVVIDPISEIFPNVFWVGVSVVTVLDNTVGGFLNLSVQRLMGTLIGGAASIVIMTITRAIFHPNWEWQAAVMLCCFMFIQVFFIAKLKVLPKYAYAGSIGLLTTVIILLSGYSDLIHDRMSYTAELGAWRTLNLIIGIVISLIVSIFVFPLKASSVMRKNLGKAMEDAAELYEKSSEYYLDFSGSGAVDESLSQKITRKLPVEGEISITEAISRTFSSRALGPDQMRQQIEDSSKFWTHDAITNISNQAFGVLSKLQTESTRLRNVSNEYYVQIIFHIIGGGKDRCKRDLRRAKRYNEAIEAMKRVVWPLVSFRLLLPLISLSQTATRLEEVTGATDRTPHASDALTLKERITPTRETLESFGDSLQVMLRLGRILKDYNRPLSEFPDDWLEIDRMVTAGNLHIQRELRQTVKIGMHGENMDGLKLLSYYGFLVRCSMIWDGLRTVVEKLSPLNGTLSRASSVGLGTPLPNREYVCAGE